jgi:hypothetical protein
MFLESPKREINIKLSSDEAFGIFFQQSCKVINFLVDFLAVMWVDVMTKNRRIIKIYVKNFPRLFFYLKNSLYSPVLLERMWAQFRSSRPCSCTISVENKRLETLHRSDMRCRHKSNTKSHIFEHRLDWELKLDKKYYFLENFN